MAAYGGLVSLVNLMDQIQLYHARKPLFVEEQQIQLETLHKKVVFLQNFLEIHSSGGSSEAEALESRIVNAVYAAEDLIESHIVDDIHARSTSTRKHDFNDGFSQGLLKVIEDMDFIRKEAVKIEDNVSLDNKKPRVLTTYIGSHLLPPTTSDPMVAFNDSLVNQVTEKLIAQNPNLQIIPITGMGGIGKTTLARHVYDSPIFKQLFDIRGWATISQDFNPRDILFALLRGMGVVENGDENSEYHELGNILHKHLTGRRYLIVMDDIWSLEPWDKVKIFLPDNGKRSRVIITTRQSNIANNICSSNTYEMNLLDENESWSLLLRKVFVQRSCPCELEEIGKRIARKCNGLPLSISVIGGVLAKSMEQEYWENVVEAISESVNSEEDGRYLQILYTSYRHLPIHLKPCFLYFGVFPEDHDIRVSQLKKLWVAEGFLKPEKGKTMEEIASDYLKDLVDRNLIHVGKFGSIGNVKFCKIHDLLRDLCLREAKMERFLCATEVLNPEVSQGFNSERRIALHSSRIALHSSESWELYSHKLDHVLQSSPFIRSFICNFEFSSKPLFDAKLLRVWSLGRCCNTGFFWEHTNLRYLDFGTSYISQFPASICLLWSLQTLVLNFGFPLILPSGIWEISQLRHVLIEPEIKLRDPRGGKKDGRDDVVLENLQTLSKIHEFKCSEVVCRKIPNLRKLKVVYDRWDFVPEHFQNLSRLTKLETLDCLIKEYSLPVLKKLEFPLSLKKLNLKLMSYTWEDIGETIGSLPHLEKFKLEYSDLGEEWESVDGHFPRLKYLSITAQTLKRWTAESSHFPCLEHLNLAAFQLEEIPSEIGEIPTLRSIKLHECRVSAVESVKRIIEEQRSFGNQEIAFEYKEGFSFTEVDYIRTRNKVTCCHFSSHVRLLASAGHDKKVVLWNMDTRQTESTPEEHQHVITDVRFRPNSTQFATASFDKSVRLWDAANPSYCVNAYTGHTSHIMSLDFHPKKNDLFCFCDSNNEIHYWNISPFSCNRISKQGGNAQVRFQPVSGHLLAAALDKVVSIYDVENDRQTHSFQGHSGIVNNLCWNPSGKLLASISEDNIKVWSLNTGECIHELSSNGNQFHSCVFHPSYIGILVIGGLRSLVLWNMAEDRSMTLPAHEHIIAALTLSPHTGMVASASHDSFVKLWR